MEAEAHATRAARGAREGGEAPDATREGEHARAAACAGAAAAGAPREGGRATALGGARKHVGAGQTALLREFTSAMKELDMIYRRVAKDASMSLATFNILTVLSDRDGCTQKDLGEALFMPKQTVHSSVRAMERAGLVRLEAGCGREVRVSLTEDGWDAVECEIVRVCQAEERAFAQMGVEEQRLFVRLVRTFATTLRGEFEHLGS